MNRRDDDAHDATDLGRALRAVEQQAPVDADRRRRVQAQMMAEYRSARVLRVADVDDQPALVKLDPFEPTPPSSRLARWWRRPVALAAAMLLVVGGLGAWWAASRSESVDTTYVSVDSTVSSDALGVAVSLDAGGRSVIQESEGILALARPGESQADVVLIRLANRAPVDVLAALGVPDLATQYSVGELAGLRADIAVVTVPDAVARQHGCVSLQPCVEVIDDPMVSLNAGTTHEVAVVEWTDGSTIVVLSYGDLPEHLLSSIQLGG